MKRKQEREIIILALYIMELTDVSMVEALNILKDQLKFKEPSPYIIQSIEGVVTDLEEIDDIISRNLYHYTIDRMSFVDRQIVRFATYEMTLRDPELVPAIIINEAIEFSKKYSDLDNGKASAFVNSLLDNIKEDLNV